MWALETLKTICYAMMAQCYQCPLYIDLHGRNNQYLPHFVVFRSAMHAISLVRLMSTKHDF